jgi:hypothetical protein
MKTPGHYFCDRCDDVAFGETCQVCSAQTRFISTDPVGHSGIALRPVSDQVAADYFRRIRDTIAAVNPK